MSQLREVVDRIREAHLFDVAWYLERYPDVALTAMDPVEHYVKIGARLGRDPGPNFSTHGYMQAHPDVEQVGENPLYHYLRWGKDEGRLAPLSKAAWEDTPVFNVEEEPLKGYSDESLVQVRKRCKELEEENELLLLQLHQVQEELEEYFLKYQELMGKMDL